MGINSEQTKDSSGTVGEKTRNVIIYNTRKMTESSFKK